MSKFELIIKKLEIVKDTEENGCYICDKEHSKILLDGINKYKEVLDKIKEYIKEEKEEYEKGKESYKRIGIEDYTRGQLVAYKHIEELLEEIE